MCIISVSLNAQLLSKELLKTMNSKNFQFKLSDVQRDPEAYLNWFLSRPVEIIIDYLYLNLGEAEEQVMDYLGETYAPVSDLLIPLMNFQMSERPSTKIMKNYLIEKERDWFIQKLLKIRELLGSQGEAFTFNKPFPEASNP